MHRLVEGMVNLQRNPGAPTQIQAGVAADVGTGPAPALDDHRHDIETAAPSPITLGAAAAEGTSSALARADHIHDTVGLEAEIDAKIAATGGWSRHFLLIGAGE